MDISYDLINKYEENKVILYNPEYEYIKTPKNKNIFILSLYDIKYFIIWKIFF